MLERIVSLLRHCGEGAALVCALVMSTPSFAQTPSGAPATTPQAQGGAAGTATGASGTAGTADTAPAASTGDAAQARNPAAKINLVDGQVRIVGPDKVSHSGKVGDQLYEGDAIVTGDGAEIHLDMADGGFIAVRPNSQVRIAKYQANGDSGDVSVIGLLKGSLRSITGWIGKTYPRNYSVITPSATIGVRGTDHEPAYIPEGTQGTDAGTYDTVHAGQTSMATSHGTIDVLPGKAGFVDQHGSQPRVLDKVPAFFQAPHAHDAVFVGKHEKIAASLEQKRQTRVQQHAQELKQGGARGGANNPAARQTTGRAPLQPANKAAAAAARPGQPAAAAANKPAAPQQQGNLLQRMMHPNAPAPAAGQKAPVVVPKVEPKVDLKKKTN
jgi:hypothetical protein